MRTLIGCVVLLFSMLAAGAKLTEGFTLWTSEAARALEVQRNPRTLPSIYLIDASGKPFNLHEITEQGRKVVLLDFFFTRCQTVCNILGQRFQQLQTEIQARGLRERVSLLSISFDQGHDTPQELAAYAMRMQADSSIWHIATSASVLDRATALEAFQVMVIPDPLLLFQHNAAIHVLDTKARLARIVDYDDPRSPLDIAQDLTLKTATSGIEQ